MLESFFNKKQNLSEISIDSISIYEGQRSAALKFSPTLLFLAREKFNEQLAGELNRGLSNSSFSEFATGYAYLMANSSQGLDSILKTLLLKIHQKLHAKDLQEVVNMLHLLLQNPTLNINEKLVLEGIANSKNQTCLEHLFWLWENCDDSNNKLILSEIITHVIAVNPNLSDVTPGIKLECFYALLSILACSSAKRYINNLSSFSYALILPAVIPQLFLCASAISAGYFTALHQDNLRKSASVQGKISISPTYFIGAFAHKYPVLINSGSITRRMDDTLHLEEEKPFTEYKYRDKYLERMLFHKDVANAFAPILSITFIASNFKKIVSEITGDASKVEDFLKIYELAEKGALVINLPTMMVISEVFNQICYPGYESFLKGKQIERNSNLSFESLFYAITVALILNNKDTVQGEELEVLENFSNTCAGNLRTAGCKPDRDALDKAWKQTLENFDRLYDAPSTCSKKEEIEVISPTILKTDFSSQVASSLKELTISSLNGWAEDNQVTLRRLNIGLRTCAFSCAVLLFTHPIMQPIFLVGAIGYSVDHYFRPQISGAKEFVKKVCSSGYSIANSVYSKSIS